jgi:hypothetical protein
MANRAKGYLGLLGVLALVACSIAPTLASPSTPTSTLSVSKMPAVQAESVARPQGNLIARYMLAIEDAVVANWLRPDNLPKGACIVHVVQLPGGRVVGATADSSCPYNEAGRRSVENAVLRTETLPYKGFESAFHRDIDISFVASDPTEGHIPASSP